MHRSKFSVLLSLTFLLISAIGSGSFGQTVRPSAKPRPSPAPTPTPAPRVQPAATPTPTPTPAPVIQTLADLQAKIASRLASSELRRGMVGVKIVSSNSGKVLFEQNAEKYLMPASNMKNFTVAAGLERLTPDFRFITSVYAPGPVGADGVVNGGLRIYGRGDVSISTAFSEGNYYKGLDDLADRIITAGVKRIQGDLIGDDSYFVGDALPGSWEWDDLQWYYGAEVSALSLNDNAVDLSVTPGPVGYGCSVKLSPLNLVYRVTNLCTTTAAGAPRTLRITKKLDQNILEITGTLPAGNPGFSGSVTVTRPAQLFVQLLKERLALKGVTVSGAARAINLNPPPAAPGANGEVEIAKLESAPFALIAAKTMKPSQNMYTETILRTLGEQSRLEDSAMAAPAAPAPGNRKTSTELGIAAVRKFLTEAGVASDGVVQYDGSGLSRHNLITPAAVIQLYTYMAKQSRYAAAWRDSLTIAGVDGTLRNRFRGTAAANNVRGKTGTIDQVSALSGYLTTATGEPVIFSIVVNGVPEGAARTQLIDAIVLSVVNFNGRIE